MIIRGISYPSGRRKSEMSLAASSLLLFLLLSTMANQALSDGQGVFEIRLKNFENSLSADAEGKCCSGGYRTPGARCSGECATKFRVCLKHYQKKVDPGHECTFGESLTPVMGDDIADFDTIMFPLDFKWPGTFSLIIEAWHENNRTTDGKTLISRLATQNQLDAGTKWTRGVHQESHTRLEYEYRMVCSAHYYGKDCDTLCRPRDDQFGHYTCGVDGEKKCLPGWQKDPSRPEGDYCTKAECKPGCHAEHGECDQPGQCKCKTGWTGPLCDQCVRYPGCQHGSCSQPYECRCDEGWGGLFCNLDLNYCTNHRPCQNGATCRNTGQGSYTCSCPPGWTGTNCESRISNECSHQPCLNGGTCQGDGLRDYKCVCPLGFHGRDCERRAQTCADDPCKNGAECFESPSGGYQCKCPPDYQGVNCDVKIDHCRATPCQNGGTCESTGPDSYRCRCPAGFAGRHCQTNVDDCALNPCRNGGTCFDFVGDYKCYCHAGFVGRNCEHNVNDCRAQPCANGGTCHDQINDFVCTCPPGFTGKDCSQEVNECARSPCLNGFCINKMNDFECKCLPGYSGKHCNVLPDGTVLKLIGEKGEQEDGGGDDDVDDNQWALILTCATVIPCLVLMAALYLWCAKRRRRAEQRRADAEAKRENELNAINCVNKTKMLDDHMIVNSLDFPSRQNKRVNANPNLTDEDAFSAKDSSYNRSKQINTDQGPPLRSLSSRTSMMLCDKLENAASAAAAAAASSVAGSSCSSSPAVMKSYDKPRLSNLPSASARRGLEMSSSASTSSSAASTVSGTSSVCSSDLRQQMSSNEKELGLPTASSIALAAASRASNHSSPEKLYLQQQQQQQQQLKKHQQQLPADLFATEV